MCLVNKSLWKLTRVNILEIMRTKRLEFQTPPPNTKIFSRGVYCFAVFRARVGRNNILCISRDSVLTNQQLPTLYSSGVAKRLARKV